MTAGTFNPLLALTALVLFGVSAVVHGQGYTSIVVFGDSLSDTGNVADLFQASYGVRVPSPIVDYTNGRFTDGTDTFPPAINARGVWVEQLAAMLPAKPTIKNSLEGGTNYAYGFAETKGGTSALTVSALNMTVSVNVDNLGLQITHYLATHPKITSKTLFVVWGGANDVLEATGASAVSSAAINEAGDIQRLIDAGATQFLIPNLPPLGAIPRLNGLGSTSVMGTEASLLYNGTLSASLDVLQWINFFRRPTFYRLDVFKLFSKVIASPSSFYLANVYSPAQLQRVNPDTYLFWDDLHPTTHGHTLLALAALKLIDPGTCAAETVTLPACESVP